MAVPWLDDEEEGQGEEQSSGGGGTVGGAPAVGMEQPSDSPGTSSGSYTNLQKYVEANKGRDFGGQVAGKIEGGVQEGLSQLGQRESEFKADVDKNKLSFGDELKSKIESAPQSLVNQDKEQAKKLLTGSYQGPTDFSGGTEEDDPYGQLRRYFGDLEEQKDAIGKVSGKKALLEKYYNRPTYTSGEKDLDTYLLNLQKAPIEAAQQNLSSAIDTYGKKKEELSGYASGAKKGSDEAKSQYRALLGLDDSGMVKDYKKGEAPTGLIQKDLERLYQKADERAKQQQQNLSRANLVKMGAELNQTTPELKSMFQDLGGLDRTYGVDPLQFLKAEPVSNINYQRVANQDDLARLQALTDLAGTSQTYLDPNLIGTMDDEALTSFDLNKYLEAVNQQKARLGDEMSNTYYSPFDSNVWQYNSSPYARSGNLTPGIQQGENYDPEQVLRNEIANNPRDAVIRQRQLDELLAKRRQIEDKYGYHNLIKR